ncbi:hypothetical protein CGC21_22675 [Leishmania donovani]|uniref:Uncharacterized protein n=1 Tax=Leishmania donovani TaxID=5661 RepID=A0A504Y134_LEIDO|nr:hypothetical protein CGC21_22675 [Leishmania donovani]
MDWDRPSGKRRRTDEEEACEALGGLLRQTASRAMERVRLQRQQRGWESQLTVLSSSAAAAVARSVKPMDVLVIRFCMHYLDCSKVAAANHFVRLAQEVVTSSIERVLVPQLFSRDGSSLPALCESLVAEHTAEDIQVTVKEVSEFEGEDHGAEDDGRSASPHQDAEDFALATTLYQACEFWVRVQAFLNSLSLHSARLHVFAMPPRYERELLLLLTTPAEGASLSSSANAAAAKAEAKETIKHEPMWDGDGEVAAQVVGEGGTDDEGAEQTEASAGPRQPQQLYKASALLADVLALSRCPEAPTGSSSSPTGTASDPALISSPLSAAAPRISAEAMQRLRGLNSNFYKMVYARLGL